MTNFALMIIGPAGAGKSTLTTTLQMHAQSLHRTVHVVNLDPAADPEVRDDPIKPAIDIRDLISVEDVMEEMHLGPNGALIYCMEYLLANADWLHDHLGNFDNDYLIFDCPGQIELYTHFPVIKNLVSLLNNWNYRTCALYVLDSQFLADTPKFFSGVLSAMSAMIQLEVPHINVLTKLDLLPSRANLSSTTTSTTLSPDMGPIRVDSSANPKAHIPHEEDDDPYVHLNEFLFPDPTLLASSANSQTHPRFHALNSALVRLIDEYNMVSFLPLNIKDERTIRNLFYQADLCLQWDEDQEPMEPRDIDRDDNDDDEPDLLEGGRDGVTEEYGF